MGGPPGMRNHTLSVAEMVDARPQKSPTHREAEEHDENLLRVGICLVLRHLIASWMRRRGEISRAK